MGIEVVKANASDWIVQERTLHCVGKIVAANMTCSATAVRLGELFYEPGLAVSAHSHGRAIVPVVPLLPTHNVGMNLAVAFKPRCRGLWLSDA
jgi:hypothetical protein